MSVRIWYKTRYEAVGFVGEPVRLYLSLTATLRRGVCQYGAYGEAQIGRIQGGTCEALSVAQGYPAARCLPV